MKRIRSKHAIAAAAIAICALFAISGFTEGPTFRADYRFSGTALTGFHPLGAADWKVQNGEIVGTPKSAAGGWLLLDGKEFQDTQIYASVKCVAGCKAGILMRAEKTPDGGMKGLLMSVTEDDLLPYLVRIDGSGNEVTREALPAPPGRGGAGRGAGGGAGRGAAGPANGAANDATARMTAATAALSGGRVINPGPAPPISPELAAQYPKESHLAQRPTGAFEAGGYNDVEVLVTDNSVQPKFNGGSLGGGAGRNIPDPEKDGYGQIGFYVGGTGEVHIRDFMYKDILNHTWAPEETSKNFKEVRVDPHYYSWSTAVADFNHDGKLDIAAGPFYYLGPDFRVGKQIYTPVSFNPTSEWPIPAMVNIAYDFTGDGWPDILQMAGNAGNGTGYLFVNPKGQSRHWQKYITIAPVGNEETLFKDIDGDGRPDLIHAGMNRLRYSTFDPKKWDPNNPTVMWTTHDVSEPGPWGVNIGHGLGVADINGDGRMDFLNAYGWWEQPPPGTPGTWKMHPVAFGRWGATQGGAGGAELCAYDVNGDGLIDVVGPMEGHGFGVAWWEQKRDANNNVSFVQHVVMDNFVTKNAGGVIFTEPHAAACADMDGDGIPDLVTGKRYMSHFGYSDPDPWSEPVLYVFHTVRDKSAAGGARFEPELVNNRSGVGSHFVLVDVNGDGMPDIVTSENLGTYVFLNLKKKQ
ncbi:MAG TPA: FG-GAP-like repeat-containing protein [Bryobacteraceae bacterium]|nr:FG-GAP-like repeat-containing protein [Bryobacteraceae bacterium]